MRTGSFFSIKSFKLLVYYIYSILVVRLLVVRLDPEDNISINIEAKYDEKIEEHKSRRLFDQPK